MSNWIPYHVNPYSSSYTEQMTCVGNLVTIAHRISECNRIRSVEAEYDNDTAFANCMASNNTYFRIRLYQGDTHRSIIVDMRRMSGCSLIFQKEYRAIMNAAKFGEIAPREVLENFKISPSDMQYRNNEFIPLQDGILEQTFLSLKNRLLSDCHDLRMLALEDVASFTNPTYSSDDTALNVCKVIMEPKSNIREYMASIISEKEVSLLDGKYMRTLAISIMTNVLSTLSKEKILTIFIQDKWYTTTLMPSLIDQIKNAAKHPCNSSLAAKCLSALFANSAEACSQAERDTLVVLEAAKRVGKSSYANLEKEAQIAIEEMVQREN